MTQRTKIAPLVVLRPLDADPRPLLYEHYSLETNGRTSLLLVWVYRLALVPELAFDLALVPVRCLALALVHENMAI